MPHANAASPNLDSFLLVSTGSPLTVGDQFVAGLGAGVAASMVACPTELIKCRLQAQTGTAPGNTSSAVVTCSYLEPERHTSLHGVRKAEGGHGAAAEGRRPSKSALQGPTRRGRQSVFDGGRAAWAVQGSGSHTAARSARQRAHVQLL